MNHATYEDLDAVLELQKISYPTEFHESRDVFASMLGNYSFIYKIHNNIIGYLFAHPWNQSQLPPNLHQPITTPITNHNCIFIHDLVIHPQYRQNGYAKEMLQSIKNMKLPILLCAVLGAESYWKKQGFQIQKGKYQTYGVLMTYFFDVTHLQSHV